MAKTNDLRDISEDDNRLFGELKMWYDAKRHPKIVGVVVEAKANAILFRKLFNQKQAEFFFAQGWPKVKKVLASATQYEMLGIIGIIDADFRRILEEQAPQNMFMTDGHDTEIMLAHSEAWESAVNQYCDPKKQETFESNHASLLLPLLLARLKPLSILRFLKEKYALPLVFRTQKNNKYEYIKYKDFVNATTLEIDLDKMLRAVENKSVMPGYFFQNPSYRAELERMMSEELDLKEYSNGHDLMNLLGIALEKAISNKANTESVTGEKLEEALVIAYRISDFEKTNLHLALKDWAIKHDFPLLPKQ